MLRNITLSIATLGVVIGSPWLALGQSSSANDPAVVIAVKNISAQLDDIKYLGEKAGFGDEVAMLPFMVRGMMPGIDMRKPAGVAVWFEGEDPVALAMVPVSDIEQLWEHLFNLGVNVDEDGNFYHVETPLADIVVRVQNGYAFVSDSKSNLTTLPDNPDGLLGKIGQDYMLGAKVFVQRIPEGLREMAIAQMQQGFEQALEEMDDGSLGDLQREANEIQINQLIEMVENSDTLELGLGVQRASNHLVFDFSFTGLPESKMAQQAAATSGKTSKFTRFLMDSAAMNMNGFGVILEDDQRTLKAMLANLRQTAMSEVEDGNMNRDEVALVKDLLSDMFELINGTVESGYMDFGGTVMLDEQGANLVAGGALANPATFDRMVAKFSEMAKTQNEVAIDVRDANVAGVALKQMIVTLPADVDQELIDMVGDKITILMGRQGEAAFVAAGSDPVSAFEAVMQNSASAGDSTVQYNIRVLPILKFAARNPDVAAMLGPVMARFTSQNDRISLHQRMIPLGVSVQGRMDADLLQLIGDAAQMSQGMMMRPGADF
jgi:hypothetical protein